MPVMCRIYIVHASYIKHDISRFPIFMGTSALLRVKDSAFPLLKEANFFPPLLSLGAFKQTSPTADKEQRARVHTLELCACRFVT